MNIPRQHTIFLIAVLLCGFAVPVLHGQDNADSPKPTPNGALVPLNDLGARQYQGFKGGLYAEGKNEPHGSYAESLRRIASTITPLDANGKPSAEGKIVIVGIGASVCRQIFTALEQIGPTAAGKRAEVVFVNAAKGGHDVNKISDPERRYWESAKAVVEAAGCTAAQVQVAWYQSDDLRDARDDFPGRPQRMQESIAKNMRELKTNFPNTRICYHSARHSTAFTPDKGAKDKHGEPRPYHVGWSVKWLMEAQSSGQTDLAFEGAAAKAPLIAWAGYFWTDGEKPRGDGYTWTREMNVADGVHLTEAGQQRVANELLAFWSKDDFAKTWFTGKGTTAKAPAKVAAGPDGKVKPQIAAAQALKPGEPALLINGRSKFAKLEQLLATKEPVRFVVLDVNTNKELLVIEDVFHVRTNLNEKLGAGEFRMRFLDKEGNRLPMTMDVSDLVRLK